MPALRIERPTDRAALAPIAQPIALPRAPFFRPREGCGGAQQDGKAELRALLGQRTETAALRDSNVALVAAQAGTNERPAAPSLCTS